MLAILEQYGSSEKEFEMPEVEAGLSSEEFLPGRSDSEVLSPGYTVADYRADRMIGKKIQDVIAQMQALDRASADYETKKEELYQKGKELVEQIYSRKYTAEMQGALDGAHE